MCKISTLNFSMGFISLANDIESAGFTCTCNLVCLEVGSRGLITSNNKGQFKIITKIAESKRANGFLAQAIRIAVSCSYVIFNARYEKDWFDVNDTFSSHLYTQVSFFNYQSLPAH